MEVLQPCSTRKRSTIRWEWREMRSTNIYWSVWRQSVLLRSVPTNLDLSWHMMWPKAIYTSQSIQLLVWEEKSSCPAYIVFKGIPITQRVFWEYLISHIANYIIYAFSRSFNWLEGTMWPKLDLPFYSFIKQNRR